MKTRNLLTLIALFALFLSPVSSSFAQTNKTTPDTRAQITASQNEQININTATDTLLITIPGIGPRTAERIITWRTENGNFKNVDELTQVKGIGAKKLAKMKPFIRS